MEPKIKHFYVQVINGADVNIFFENVKKCRSIRLFSYENYSTFKTIIIKIIIKIKNRALYEYTRENVQKSVNFFFSRIRVVLNTMNDELIENEKKRVRLTSTGFPKHLL